LDLRQVHLVEDDLLEVAANAEFEVLVCGADVAIAAGILKTTTRLP
jgi:hypothetical protein